MFVKIFGAAVWFDVVVSIIEWQVGKDFRSLIGFNGTLDDFICQYFFKYLCRLRKSYLPDRRFDVLKCRTKTQNA